MHINFKFTKTFLLFFINCYMLNGLELNHKSEFLLENKRAGRLMIGMSVDDLYKNYSYNLTKIVDLFKEGMFTPAIEIYLNGKESKPSIIAEINCLDGFKIDRITVFEKRFKTEKGIGVGSKLKDILNFYKIDWADFVEGNFFIRVEELGMSFILNLEKVPEKWFEKKDINLIPKSTEIKAILID